MLSILILASGLLSILILLEFIGLSLYLMMCTITYENHLEMIVFLILLVLEAVTGLLMLVLKVLVSGEETLSSNNIN